MKELTTLNSNFTESEVKKEKKFSRSPNFDFTCTHFNIYECLKWLEKPIWLINIKFCDSTDMFNKHRSTSAKGFLRVSQNSQEIIYVGAFYLKK